MGGIFRRSGDRHLASALRTPAQDASRNNQSPVKQPAEPPPTYEEQYQPIAIPRKEALAIINNVDSIMDQVVRELDALVDDTSNTIDAVNHIRESCSLVSATVVRTMLPNVTEAMLREDARQCRKGLYRTFTAVMDAVSMDKKMPVSVLHAEAVTKAAYQARFDSKDFRTTAWAASMASTAHGIVSSDTIELYRKSG